MSKDSDIPTTQELLLDHLLRLSEGMSWTEEEGRTIWTFGFGDDALTSLYGFGTEPTLEQKEQNKKRKSEAKAKLVYASLGIEAKDHMGVPKRLTKIRGEILSKDRQAVSEALKYFSSGGYAEDGYALEMLWKLRDVVERAQKAVKEVHLLSKVPASVDNYMSEAASCFRYGFDLACVSLCRCVLEEALNDCVGKSYGREATKGVKLREKIDMAVKLGILNSKLKSTAHRIRQSGNKCAHGSLNEEQAKRTALKVLKNSQEIVRDLYSD